MEGGFNPFKSRSADRGFLRSVERHPWPPGNVFWARFGRVDGKGYNYKCFFIHLGYTKTLQLIKSTVGGGLKHICYFYPCFGKIPILTTLFFSNGSKPPTSLRCHCLSLGMTSYC